MRGTLKHPFRSIKELKEGIKNKEKCTLYTYGTWILSKEMQWELENKRIILVGVAVAYMQRAGKEATQKATADVLREKIEIHLPGNTKVSVYKDDLVKQIEDSIYKDTFISGMR